MKRYLTSTFSALGVRDYRRFAVGQAISVSGTWMQKLAQGWLVLELTNSPVLLGVTVAMQQLPTLLFTTVGGALADRFDKRTILLWMAIGATLPALALGVLVQLHLVQVWIVLLAALIQGLFDAVEKPARLTVVNDIATPATLTNAVMFNGIIQDSGKVAGPAIAGILISSVGISAAFFINALSYLPVVVALLLIKPHVPVGPVATFKAMGNLTGTLRYVAGRPKLAAALALMTVAGLLAYNWNVLLPTLTRDVFHGDARIVGFAFTSMGLGAVLGGVALAGFLKPGSRRLIINGCVFAAFLVLLGLAPTLGVAYVLLFGVGAFSVTFRATATALLQLYADPQMRGRVISLLVLATAGTTPIGGPIIGWICEHSSPRVACMVGGLGTALAALACFVYLQAKRSVAEQDYESVTSRSSDGNAAKMACRSSSESRPT
ncbi:MFS transporter [Mycobacterium sp. AZCC_0083]|uniref:MFS transporter n=1 Tax=Mycobacterium sp. AZCC_0083 TaxID=2735882 RepID=UPI00161084AC|nr:MFS transporter [Mycobacterium sp. AZCC_0083]MBB5165377.1 MFS family permease [Mycobacterium sp. AZCC_0083]